MAGRSCVPWAWGGLVACVVGARRGALRRGFSNSWLPGAGSAAFFWRGVVELRDPNPGPMVVSDRMS